ncbi:hypothetical protein [Lederbergia panacisoli]|nr:hypothetical protein [Lederbergia panacisoli]MCR2822956.1 hypothetical protein [Lederbergia panacisoli]
MKGLMNGIIRVAIIDDNFEWIGEKIRLIDENCEGIDENFGVIVGSLVGN